MFSKESIPFAPSLIESMRSLGYSFESAIADIVDNSISANASKIDIKVSLGNKPYIIIFDNGCGMNKNEIEEAMRYGSKNPLEKREVTDLGRFGLGLKSASLSQCRKLVVVSKKDGQLSCYSWDLDYIIKKASWSMIGYTKEEILMFPEIEMFNEVDTGTYVLLEQFDRIKESTNDLNKTLTNKVDSMINHLALVFHRFLERKVEISVNNKKVEGREPFLSNHKGTQIKRSQNVNINGFNIVVKPYILPHLNKLTLKDIEKVGSKESLRNEQGFYIYRNERLIIWGTWFRLERKDELSKLARVMVDIPSDLDYMWNIDIKKSSANLPDIIKRSLYNCVIESVGGSEAVHTYRGRKIQSTDINLIWERIEVRDNYYEYRVNRDIPQLKILEASLNLKQLKYLNEMITQLEERFPITNLYVDVAKGKVVEQSVEDEERVEELYMQVKEQVEYAKESGMDYKIMAKAFISTEPYCNFNQIITKIKEVYEIE
ncbi:MAG: ATP-binding protein [Clostridium sp.]|uniref:ATP-binding protein n=1 Tax=Clostridium sp. TaxID=1506 RepID=UPI002913EB3E|nr:ATP-binding protein [Clostridium sp.]MDU5110580.1 ATP-binding protein [Clostridium sp.]